MKSQTITGIKTPAIVGIALAAVVAGFILYKKRAIDSLNIFIWNISVRFVNFEPVLTVRFRIQNPSNQSFDVNSIVGSLSVNGTPIGNASQFQKITIAGVSQTDYDIDVQLNLVGAGSDLVNMLQQGSGISQTLRFDGNINANGILWPLALEYKIV